MTKSFLTLIRQARARPWREIPWRTRRVLGRWFWGAIERARVQTIEVDVSPKELQRALFVPRAIAAERVGRRPLGQMSVSGDARKAAAREFKEHHAEVFEAILAEAANALAHRFDLLGSGLTDLGATIDWCCDFKTGFRWPRGYVKDMALVDLSNQADVKVPWDLSRGYQLVRLGQAFWLTDDERFARELIAQWQSWILENPPLQTCNWGNAMEAAIRVCNWCVAFTLTRDSVAQTAETRERFLRSALEHGRFIAGNLERSEGYPTSNHYLSDLVGLVYLGVLIPDLKESAVWLETGMRGLESEVLIQVGTDGFDYEGSTNYHRLVGELVLSAFELARQNGHAPAKEARDRIVAMAEATLNYMRPDGRAPLIGDVDNGRLHWLTPEAPDDHRSFLGQAAVATGRADFARAAGRARAEGFWWGAAPPLSHDASPPLLSSKLFEVAGIAVLRAEGAHVILHCGEPRGPRGHFHNDTLSVEVSLLDLPWIVDPGTYAYTSSEADRNHFRRTEAHNTVQVDHAEINEIAPQQLFDLKFGSDPRLVEWTVSPQSTRVVGQHDGYSRIEGVGRHTRVVTLDSAGAVEIVDSVSGDGPRLHTIETFLHLDPAVQAEQRGASVVLTRSDSNGSLIVSFAFPGSEATIALTNDWVARGYGHRQRGLVIRTTASASLPWTQETRITVLR